MNRIKPNPKVGDMLIVSIKRMDGHCTKFTGLIYEIKDKQGSRDAFVHWVDAKPYNYRESFGYPVINIINEYDMFKVIEV